MIRLKGVSDYSSKVLDILEIQGFRDKTLINIIAVWEERGLSYKEIDNAIYKLTNLLMLETQKKGGK
jgi:hypothetical protein